jgi:NodT family efflux transporter outer membrane factor (OMF) lipoprotein
MSDSLIIPVRRAAPLALLLLAACAAVPDLGPKPNPVSPEAVAAERSLSPSVNAAWPGDGWWKVYGDSQLDGLIEEGLRNSPDVSVALARYRQAGGYAQQAGAALLPRVDVQGDVTVDKQSYNNGFPREFLPQGWKDTGQLAANLGFDLDLWGRNRAALAAATSEERAAAVEVQQAQLLLTTGIALAYVDLQQQFIERDIRQSTLNLRLSNQKLVTDRQVNGLENRVSVRQADAEVESARTSLSEANEAIEIRQHQIAALIGAGPDRGLAITQPNLPALTTGVPAGATTDLIGRRPDIAAARERVEAAASRIKVARADFFPAVNIGALVGVQSLGLDNLFQKGSIFGNVGPAVSLPIFHGGELQGRFRETRGEYDEAVANYDSTVLGAYQQVADAVTSDRSLDQRVIDARKALAASEEAYSLARQRYEGGLSTYLDVLQVEDRMLIARSRVAAIEAAARSIDITLIRALGGGFNTATAATMNSKDVPNG